MTTIRTINDPIAGLTVIGEDKGATLYVDELTEDEVLLTVVKGYNVAQIALTVDQLADIARVFLELPLNRVF